MRSKRFVGLYVIIAIALVISCGGPEKRKMKFFNRGMALYEKGDYVRARLEFKNVVQIDSRFARAYYRLGECELRLRNIKRAFGFLNKAVELDPQLWEAQLTLAQMLFLASQIDEAKKRVALVLENKPDHTSALLFKSHLLIQENRADQAEEILKRVIETDPNNVKGYLALAALMEKTSVSQAAEKILQQGLKRNKKSPALLLAAARLYMRREDFSNAASFYEKLVQYYPKKKEYAIFLARYHEKVGQPEKAKEIYKTLIKEEPGNAEYRVILAKFYREQRAPDAEMEVLTKAVRDLPADLKLPLLLAEAFLKNNRIDPALKTYRDLVENHWSKPEAVAARVNIAKIYFLQGKMDQALSEVGRVLKKSSSNIDARSLRGKIFLAQGKTVAAVGDFRLIIKEEPNEPKGYVSLAQAHLQNKEEILALEVLKKTLQIDPRHQRALDLILHLYRRHKSYDEAISILNEILRKDPQNTYALSRLGDFHFLKGEVVQAEKTYREIEKEDSNNPERLFKMSLINIKKKQYNTAEAQLDRALALEPANMKILMRQVQLQMSLKKPEKALEKCRDHIRKIPSVEAEIRLLMSQILSVQKDFPSALAEIKKAIKLRPGSMDPYRAMGSLFLSSGEIDKAINEFQSALIKKPNAVQFKFFIAILFEKKEDYQGAVKWYEKVLNEHPDFTPAWNNLAYLYADRFPKNENLDWALALLKDIPEHRLDAYTLDTIGWLCYQKKEYDQAIENFKRSEAKKHLPIVQLHLGLAYMAKGQKKQAQRAIEIALENNGGDLSDRDRTSARKTLRVLAKEMVKK